MPTFVWVVLTILLAWGLIVGLIARALVKSGKVQLKRGGAPGTSSSRGSSDSSLNL